MATMVRIQERDRDASDLLDESNWISAQWGGNGEDVRHGISACWNVPELAAYWRKHGGDLTDVVLVEFEGYRADEDGQEDDAHAATPAAG